MIRILVIEDNINIILPGLRNLFRPDRDGIKITCVAPDPGEALVTARSEDFDLIILDLWIPGFLPLDNLKNLTAGFPGKPVIIYTQDDSPVWRRKMLIAGAKAYLTKSVTRDKLKCAIEAVSKGELCYTGVMSGDEQSQIGTRSGRDTTLLTPVQQRMADMLSNGMNREEIARIMDLHPSAVDKTFCKLREKFNCRNNYELIRKLIEQGTI